MGNRWTARLLVLPVLLLAPVSLEAQAAWTPAKGEVNLFFNSQWLEGDRHLLPSAIEGPDRTPLEELYGIDIPQSFDLGVFQSMAFGLDADVDVTDRLAAFAGIAFISARYIGEDIATPEEDGTFHGSFQDARVGARYMAVSDGTWAVTPFASFIFPVAGYPLFGHAARGLGLKELQLGTNVGRTLHKNSVLKGYVQGAAYYAIMENISDELKLDRLNAAMEFAYFLGRRFTLQVRVSWQKVLGGIQWTDIGSDLPEDVGVAELYEHPHLNEGFQAHDQAAATHDLRLGGGLTFQVTDSLDLQLTVNQFLWGVNTHNADAVNFGFSWGFQGFGGDNDDWDKDLWASARPSDDGEEKTADSDAEGGR